MASFLSQPQQFSRFIPTIDTESYDRTQQTYVQAGLHRQNQYDSNVQRVQSYIDNVAGLQVAREQDKAYVQNKIGELRNNLSNLISQDFAQGEVVNQAGGYASQIFNDPNIQNAVQSAHNYKDVMGQMEKARQEGKSAASNENAVMRNVKSWMNGDINTSLGKQTFTPYYNYSSAWQNFMKDKHGTKVYTETPVGRTGIGGIAYTINQGKKEYLDPATVQQDFQTFLQMDVQAATQVDTDALYYADTTPNEYAISSIRGNIESTLGAYDASLKKLQQQKVIYTSAKDQATLDAQIESINEAKNKYQATLPTREQELLDNPLQAKMRLFKENLTVGIGNRYAYEDIENKIVKNPEFDAYNDDERLRIAMNDQVLRQRADIRAEAGEARAADKYARELQEVSNNPSKYFSGGDFQGSTLTPEQIITEANQMGREVGQNQAKTLWESGMNPDGTNAFSDLILQRQDADGNVRYLIPPGKESEFHKAFREVRSAYEANPDGADASVRAYFNSQNDPNQGIGLENRYLNKKAAIDKVEQQLDLQHVNDPEYKNYINSIGQLGKSTDVIFTNGRGVNVTVDDLVKYSKLAAKGIDVYDMHKQSVDGLPLDKSLAAMAAVTASNAWGANKPANAQRISAVFGAANNTNKFQKARSEAYQKLDMKRDTRLSIESAEGPQAKQFQNELAYLNLLQNSRDAAGDGTAFGKELENVLQKEKGSQSSIAIAYELLPNGTVQARVQNGSKHTTVDLTADQAKQLRPDLFQVNQNQVLMESLNYNRVSAGQPVISPIIFTPSQPSNSGTYQFRYKVRDNGNGTAMTPLIEYSKKGENGWKSLGKFQYFSTPEQMRTFVENINKLDAPTIESKYLSE